MVIEKKICTIVFEDPGDKMTVKCHSEGFTNYELLGMIDLLHRNILNKAAIELVEKEARQGKE